MKRSIEARNAGIMSVCQYCGRDCEFCLLKVQNWALVAVLPVARKVVGPVQYVEKEEIPV